MRKVYINIMRGEPDIMEGTANAMESITAQIANITTVVGNVFSIITSNAYLCFFAAAALVGVAVHVFKIIKSAA